MAGFRLSPSVAERSGAFAILLIPALSLLQLLSSLSLSLLLWLLVPNVLFGWRDQGV